VPDRPVALLNLDVPDKFGMENEWQVPVNNNSNKKYILLFSFFWFLSLSILSN
jgi:hypothetical protein